ncbi:MAG: TonB-dependent receptor plug domain-containing protein, partial [Gemmatimonadales bacterium]
MVRRLWLSVCALVVVLAGPAYSQDSLPPSPPPRSSDTAASSRRLPGALLQHLPIDDPRQALPLVPGVILRAGELGIAATPFLLIRGGHRGAANVYVDGAPLRFQTLGSAGIGLAPNAIVEAEVVTGVASVETADAGGGAIVYRTRAGGERLMGDVRWDSDEPFGAGSSVGYNRIEGTLGGPLPLARDLSFFLSATLQGQGSAYRGPDADLVPTYMPGGADTTVDDGGTPVTLPLFVEGSGLGRPLDWSTARRVHGRMEYRYGTGSTLSITGLGGELQQRFFPGHLALNPALHHGRRAWSAAAIVNWRQDLGRLGGAPLALDVNVSLVGHRDVSGPLEPAAESATRDPSLGITFARLRFVGADVLGLPVTDQLIRDVRTVSGSRGVPFFGNGNLDLGQAHRGNPYGLAGAGWWTDGLGGTLAYVDERRLQGRWALEWTPGRTTGGRHRLALGVDAERSDVSSYASGFVTMFGTDVFAIRPSRLGVFAGDRLELDGGRSVIEVGLRYDRFDPGGEFPNVPAFISSSGAAYWNPNAATDDTAYANSVARTFTPARVQGVVSPRLRLTHALGRTASLRLGYSRTVELPAWRAVFGHSNNDLSFTDGTDLFGRDVDFPVASLIEVGVRSALGAHASIDVAAYRKDAPDYVGRFRPFPDPRDTTRMTNILVVTPVENVRVQGIDAQVSWATGWLNASAAYSLARTHAEPEPLVSPSADVTTHAAAVAALVQVPEGWRTGTAIGALSRGLRALVLLRVQSGAPYTRRINEGSGAVTPGGGLPAETFNASQLPWTKRLDLRIAKAVRAGGKDWSIYLDARNLLNFSNLGALFAETGGTENSLHRLQTIGDPTTGTGQYASLWDEAGSNSALEPDGTTVNLGACGTWGSPVN